MSLTQYLESQEDQDKRREDYSTSLELKRREEMGVLCLGMKEKGGLYSNGGGNMNGRPFNEG